MSTDKAFVKIAKDNEPLWIYYKGRIQCFNCGWWNKEKDNIEVERAIELWKSHQCKEGKYDQ